MVKLAIIVGLGGLCGCAPKALLHNPSAWPDEWVQRRLFSTPHAYIYASNPAAAGELDRLVQTVAGDFRGDTGAEPLRPLIFVNDESDEPVIGALADLSRLAARREAPTTEDHARTDDDPPTDESESDSQVEPDELLVKCMAFMLPVRLEADDLRTLLNFPLSSADTEAGAVVAPTRAALRKSICTFLDRGLDKENVDPLTRLAALPFLAIARSAMLDGLDADRRVLLYEHLVAAQPAWSEEEKRGYAERYAARITPTNGASSLQLSPSGLTTVMAEGSRAARRRLLGGPCVLASTPRGGYSIADSGPDGRSMRAHRAQGDRAPMQKKAPDAAGTLLLTGQ